MTILLLLLLLIALIGTVVYIDRLAKTADRAPKLLLSEPTAILPTTISVIIPAYNEADNIRDCVLAVLNSSNSDKLDVWVVDDYSSDETLKIAQALQAQDSRLHVLAGKPRPEGEVWMGKNWACTQAVEHVSGELVLFLDADMRLKPGAIAAAMTTMQQEQADLLTVLSTIVCGCFAEWLAQPLIMGSIASGFDFVEVNDPKSEKVFAVGHFMLFRRTAYDQIGGHRAVADQVVEDVELGRCIKQKGLKLHYTLGHDIATVQMYPTARALWEGWTKNWYLGSRCNLPLALYGVLIIFIVCVMPLVSVLGLAIAGTALGWSGWQISAIVLALLTLVLQYPLRRQIERVSAIPTRYWWLTGFGGLFLVAIMIASIIKTETGWGWTWRGRPLTKPQSI
jgi:glycosyltransferase involved in cell wall biosynthesis